MTTSLVIRQRALIQELDLRRMIDKLNDISAILLQILLQIIANIIANIVLGRILDNHLTMASKLTSVSLSRRFTNSTLNSWNKSRQWFSHFTLDFKKITRLFDHVLETVCRRLKLRTFYVR